MISRRNIINLRKRRIILVDHNEATQAVEGFEQAEIQMCIRDRPSTAALRPGSVSAWRGECWSGWSGCGA